jgi:hypothetical protein
VGAALQLASEPSRSIAPYSMGSAAVTGLAPLRFNNPAWGVGRDRPGWDSPLEREHMRTVTIALPDVLYSDLEREAAALATLDEPRYSPANWAADCVASELAARRLPRVSRSRLTS